MEAGAALGAPCVYDVSNRGTEATELSAVISGNISVHPSFVYLRRFCLSTGNSHKVIKRFRNVCLCEALRCSVNDFLFTFCLKVEFKNMFK